MAYSLEGPTWSDTDISWSFEQSGTATNGSLTYSNPIVSAALQTLVEKALDDWQANSGVTFYQVPDNPSYSDLTPDIRIGFGNLTGQPGQADAIGLTAAYYDEDTGNFVPGIYVAAQDPSITSLAADSTGALVYNGTQSSFYQVILHEIGHALGLGHDTVDPTAVMYPVAEPTNRELGASDIAGIDSLYGANTGNYSDPTIIYMDGSAADYSMAQNGQGTLVVTDSVAGRDGTVAIATDQVFSFYNETDYSDPTGNGADVARLYLAAFDRAPDLGGLETYTNAANAGLGLTQIANDLIASPEFAANYGSLDTMQFISAAYENVLHRSADASGLQTYESAINNGVSRGQVLVDLSQSQESRAVNIGLAGDHDDAEVYRLFGAALNRQPDASGLNAYASALDNGASVASLAQGLAGSAEFLSLYGGLSNTDFVNDLYQSVLHRQGDPGGVANYVGALNAGLGRGAVVASFADSLENRILTAPMTHDGVVSLAVG